MIPSPASVVTGCTTTRVRPASSSRTINRAVVKDGREPFTGTAMEFLEALREPG